MSVKQEDIIDLEMVNVHTLERHSWKWNSARHKLVTVEVEDGSFITTAEPISGPEEGI